MTSRSLSWWFQPTHLKKINSSIFYHLPRGEDIQNICHNHLSRSLYPFLFLGSKNFDGGRLPSFSNKQPNNTPFETLRSHERLASSVVHSKLLNPHMGVNPKIGGKPPQWMVKIMENPIKMDDLGVPLFLETPIYQSSPFFRVKISPLIYCFSWTVASASSLLCRIQHVTTGLQLVMS